MAVFFNILLSVFADFVTSTKAAYVTHLATPKQSGPAEDFKYTLLCDYGYNIDSSESITFEVKACQDVNIGLMENTDVNAALYNIIIGGLINTRSYLLRRKWDWPPLIQRDGVVLDCNSFKKFHVKWANGKIELWRMDGESLVEILSYSTDTSLIKFIGVSTSTYGHGDWKIYIPASSLHQLTWNQDKQRKGQTYTSPRYRITEHRSRLDCLQKCQMHSDCRFVTYNTSLCLGFSEINSSPFISLATSLWVKTCPKL